MNATRAKEISENQRTAALISMLSPACKDPEAWTLFIKYLSSHNRLPAFSEDEEKFVQKMLLRLDIKESIVSGGRIQLPEPQDE